MQGESGAKYPKERYTICNFLNVIQQNKYVHFFNLQTNEDV